MAIGRMGDRLRWITCSVVLALWAAATGAVPTGIPAEVLREVANPAALPTGTYSQVAQWPSSQFQHLAGGAIADPDAAGGKAWGGEATLEAAGGPLLFGPYVQMPAGDYVAFFRIKQTGDLGEEMVASIDACVDRVVLAEYARELGPTDLARGRYVQAPLAFRMKGGLLECRLLWPATTSLSVDTVTLFRRTGPPAPRTVAMVPQPVATGSPANLVYRPPHPPFAGNFPRSSRPSRTLTVCDVHAKPTDVQFLAVSVQGLVNRSTPRVYCLLSDQDQTWPDWLKRTKRLDTTESVPDALALLARYRSAVKGMVITDPALPATRNVATMAAGVMDGVVVSPRLAARLDLPVLVNLRGRWRRSVDAYRWAYDTLWDRMNHYGSACLWPSDPGLRDYLIQHRLPVFWLPGRIDGAKPYANAREEMRVMERMLARMPANVPAMGLPWAGEDVGMGEQPGVSLLAEFGKYVVASVGLSNASVHSGYTAPAPRKQVASRQVLDPRKVYLSFLISDGDNVACLELHNWPDLWKEKTRGSFPVGWTISPSAALLLPDIVDYYFQTATPNDEFVAAVSGVGYTYPQIYGKRYTNPGAVLDGFLGQTARTMAGMGLRTVNPTGLGSTEIARYAERIPGLRGIFADYGRTVESYDEATLVTSGNTPVYHAVTGWVAKGDREAQITDMVTRVRKMTQPNGPTFLHAFACNWFYDIPTLQEVLRRLGPRYVAVTPSELAALYHQHLDRVMLQVRMPATMATIEGQPVAIQVPVRNVGSRPLSLRLVAATPGGKVTVSPASIRLPAAGSAQVVVKSHARAGRITLAVSGPFGRRTFATSVTVTRRSEIVGKIPAGMECVAVFEGEALQRMVGSDVAELSASAGQVRAAVKGATQPGYMAYGPYRAFKAGRYVALYRVKRTGAGVGPVCVVDAIMAGAAKTFGVKAVHAATLPVGQWRSIAVVFDHVGGPLETRVQWTGAASLVLDRVELHAVR